MTITWEDWFGPMVTLFCWEYVAPTLYCFQPNKDIHFCDKGCALTPGFWAVSHLARAPLRGRNVLRVPELILPGEGAYVPPVGNTRDALNNLRNFWPGDLKVIPDHGGTTWFKGKYTCCDGLDIWDPYKKKCDAFCAAMTGSDWPEEQCGHLLQSAAARDWELTCSHISLLGPSAGIVTYACHGESLMPILGGHGKGNLILLDHALWDHLYDCDGTKLGKQSPIVQLWNSLDVFQWNGQIVEQGTDQECEVIRMQNAAFEKMFDPDVSPLPDDTKFDRVDRRDLQSRRNNFRRRRILIPGVDYPVNMFTPIANLSDAQHVIKLARRDIQLEGELCLWAASNDLWLSFMGTAEDLEIHINRDVRGPGYDLTDPRIYAFGNPPQTTSASFYPQLWVAARMTPWLGLFRRVRIPPGTTWTNPRSDETREIRLLPNDGDGWVADGVNEYEVYWGDDPLSTEHVIYEYLGKKYEPPLWAYIEFELGPATDPMWPDLWQSSTSFEDLVNHYGIGGDYACVIAHAFKNMQSFDNGIELPVKQTSFPDADDESFQGNVRIKPTPNIYDYCDWP